MSKWVIGSVVLCTALSAAACGGGSGVTGSKTLVSLSNGEITDLCEYLIDVGGPARTIECENGDTVITGGDSVTDCIVDLQMSRDADPDCAATVDNAESCIEAFADRSVAQICDDDIPVACLPLFQCSDL